MIEINSLEQYLKLVDEALTEVDELQAACEFDEEFMSMPAYFAKPLNQTLVELKQSLNNGNHRFGGENLAYMNMLKQPLLGF